MDQLREWFTAYDADIAHVGRFWNRPYVRSRTPRRTKMQREEGPQSLGPSRLGLRLGERLWARRG